VGDSYPQLVSFFRFQSQTFSDGKNSLSLGYLDSKGIERFYSQEDVDGMIRGINFSHAAEVEKEKPKLDAFLRCNKLAWKIHELRCQLQLQGHPEYQEGSAKFPDKKTQKMDETKLKQMLSEHEAILHQWTLDKQKVLKNVPRLTLFSSSQLLAFLRAIIHALENEKTFFDVLQPHLIFLFPPEDEQSQADGEKSLNQRIAELKKVTTQIISQHKLCSMSARERKKKALESAAILIQELEKALKVNDPGSPAKGSCYLYDASGLSMTQLEASLFTYIFVGTIPKPLQIFQTKKKGSQALEDLRAFLRRCFTFVNKKYALIGLNELPSSCKEELIKELTAPQNQLPCELALIMTSDAGAEMFAFLKKKNLDISSGSVLLSTIKQSKLLEKCSILQFISVTGRAGDGKSTFIQTEFEGKAKMPGTTALVCNISEGFQTRKLIAQLQNLTPDSETVLLHFNISLYASSFIIHQLFRGILYAGMILDDESGEIFPLGPSRKWYLFVEIPEESRELPCPDLPLIKFFLSLIGLTAVSFYKILTFFYSRREVATNKKVGPDTPIVLDQDLRIVCSFLKHHFEGSLHQAKLYELPPLEETESQKVLFRLWNEQAEVGNTKFQQVSYLRHLHERCRLLQTMEREDRRLRNDGCEGYSSRDSRFFSKLFSHFLREAAFFCNGRLKGDWTKVDQGFICLGEEGYHATMLCLGPKVSTETEGPIHDRLTLKDAEENPVRLRRDLAPALGLDSSKMISILQRGAGYVLTPDFALKLFVLNERRKAGVSTLFEGDTGVGKTEILRIYMEILNSRANVMPDFFFELRTALLKVLKKTGDGIPDYQSLIENKTELKGYHQNENKRHYFSQLFQEILHIGKEEDGPRLANELLSYAEDLHRRYPLLTVPPKLKAKMEELRQEISDVIKPKKAKRTAKHTIEELVSSIVKEVIMEQMKLSPEKLFHKILMDESITPEQFKATIASIVKDSREIQKATGKESGEIATIVVFIDEINTSSILGVVKEIFLDRTLDGVLLPKNIFFVGALNPQNLSANSSSSDQYEKEFVVHPLPPSMTELIMKFDCLEFAQERIFLQNFLIEKIRIPEQRDQVYTNFPSCKRKNKAETVKPLRKKQTGHSEPNTPI